MKEAAIDLLRQEYFNNVILYTNSVAVTYTRFYGLLAAQGGLVAIIFLLPTYLPKILVALLGFGLSTFSFFSIEHVWRFVKFRTIQAREVERKLNRLSELKKDEKLSTFENQMEIFIKKTTVRFPLTGEKIPSDRFTLFIIKYFPYQAERLIGIPLIVAWAILVVLLFIRPSSF